MSFGFKDFNFADMSIHSVMSKAKGLVYSYTEWEMKVEMATNNEPWGASSTLMQEIAHGSNTYGFSEIMGMCYRKLEKRGSDWRQCYKALQLIEYLVRNGSERVAGYVREHEYELKALATFQYVDDKGKDQGINVRNRAEAVLKLVKDDERVKAERAKARENRGKYGGVGSGGVSVYSDQYMSQARAGNSSQTTPTSPAASSPPATVNNTQAAVNNGQGAANGDDFGDFVSASKSTGNLIEL